MNAFIEYGTATLKRLGTDKTAGLTDVQIAENRKQFGVNALTKEKPPTLFYRIWESAREPMIIMLILAAVITLCVNLTRYFTGSEPDFLECAGIFAAISLSVIITVVMEGRSAKAFESLSKLGDDVSVKVIRNGQTQLVPQKDIVVGDIVCVEAGNKLPADGRLLESSALRSDESTLTGESASVDKDAEAIYSNEKTPLAERANMLYSGCFITGGSGKMVVTAVGDDTEFGKIARELSNVDKTSTPLQEKLAKLGKLITILGGTAAGLVFAIQIMIFIINGTVSFNTISEAFITSIVLIVAAVPEGLPTIVAVSLAVNIIKMSKQKALVKKMIACETVGCINVICSDKTGTLTENRMTATDFFADGEHVRPESLANEELLANICVNSTADVNLKDRSYSFIGNPTECALLVAANKAEWDYSKLRLHSKVIHTFPFSSEEKDMTTIVEEDGVFISYTKGSPEKILSICIMTPEERKAAEAEIVRFQKKSYRVIGFAHRVWDTVPELIESAVESGMAFDGFAAITDPLRSDVLESVERCRDAGIGLKILTGDNIITATAIANELGILEGKYIAIDAKDLDGISDNELSDKLSCIRVIARSTPTIKMRVVNALKAMGNVVAVTGDGINDAPAIKNADVGIAMGISGTEVSKEASDIVLLDDSFSTIVRAVQWGRGIYENFQRFIQFQLTVNLSSVVVVLASILSGFAAPFTALQLLWINIVMDGPPALTLGLEPIRGDLMKREPTKRDSSIITKSMLGRIVFNGLFISAVFMAQQIWNFFSGTHEQEGTILFTLFVVFQLFNAFNCRVLNGGSIFKNLSANKLMLLVFALTFGLQVIITQFGGVLYNTVPIPFIMWVKIIGAAFGVVVIAEFVRLAKKSLIIIIGKIRRIKW